MSESADGVDLLKAWIDRQGFATQAKAAEFLELHPMVLSQILTETRRPGLAVAADIEDKTGIPCRSWVLRKLSNRSGGLVAAGRKSKISRK